MRRRMETLATLALIASVAHAETPVGGTIDTNTRWGPLGSPYVVQDDVLVSAGILLTIEPGVTVAFDGDFMLQAEAGATIQAAGTSLQKVLFTSNQSTPAPGDWNRVWALSSSTSSFEHCAFEYGARNLVLEGSDVTVSECTFRYASQYGLTVKDCSPSILNCNVYENSTGIYLGDTTKSTLPTITGCNFHDNTGYCLYLAGYSSPPLVTVDAEENWWGTTEATEIETLIRDNVDNGTIHALVDFDPWLSTTDTETLSWARIKGRYAR